MRDDHKLALKKVKQQILAFCLRHGYSYTATKSHWTAAHIAWLRSLKSKRANVAKTAVAWELACFIWGMMTDQIA